MTLLDVSSTLTLASLTFDTVAVRTGRPEHLIFFNTHRRGNTLSGAYAASAGKPWDSLKTNNIKNHHPSSHHTHTHTSLFTHAQTAHSPPQQKSNGKKHPSRLGSVQGRLTYVVASLLSLYLVIHRGKCHGPVR